VTAGVAARVFPGRAEQARQARRWVRAQAAACALAADDMELAVGELFSNAVRHTRSAVAGGTVTVAVVAVAGGVIVHVHDLGAGGGRVPCAGLALVPSSDSRGLRLGGRGLRRVAAGCAEGGAVPAVWCPDGGVGDPAVAAGGCCIWCRLQAAAGCEANR
jgi:anti-sigma regulatory factor (Ser/Thr protein kinase)